MSNKNVIQLAMFDCLPKSPQNSAEIRVVWRDLIRLNSIVFRVEMRKMYDDEVFAGRFRYQLAICGMWTGLSGLLHGLTAYEIVISKITSVNLRDVLNDVRCRTVLKR